MYIRRKVFSTVQDDYTGEQRLFSTTEFLDESLFSDEDDQEELTKADKRLLKKITLKNVNDRFAIPGADYVKTGAVGGMLGHLATSAKKSFNTRKGRLIGSAIGAAAGIGAEHLAKKRLNREINDYLKSSDGDLLKVADGKMSKKAYIKKHYNQYPELSNEDD